jgi:23S rRNA pseudouridine1911/1915/1917 synthase
MQPDAQPGVVRYLLGPELDSARLDVALAALSGLSRRHVRVVVEQGRVWVNQTPTRILSRHMTLADVVDLLPGTEQLAPPAPLPPPLPVLREDAHIIAVSKGAGVASQSPRERRPGELTAIELVALQLAARDGRRQELALIHRLDRLTTGVLLLARSKLASSKLAAAWAGGAVHKRYLAVVEGALDLEPREVEAAIGPDRSAPGRFRVSPGGRPARSEVLPLASMAGLSLVEVRPFTGRTHQVRVHLKHLGCPVAGDSLYGSSSRVPRVFLHAWELAFPHPSGGAATRITAPIPEDMARFLAASGLPVPDPGQAPLG